MDQIQVMPAPVRWLPPADVDSLLRRAAAAKGVTLDGIRQSGGISLAMTGAGAADRLIWATIGSKDGVLALFTGDRLVAWNDKDFGEITRVQPLALPGLQHYAVMVDDRYDEMVGAFVREERRRIYVWDGRGLRQVYSAPLKSEQFSHARWQNPNGPNAWRLDRTLGEVTVQDGRLTEVTRRQQLEAPGAANAPIPPESAFRLRSEQRQERHLTWSPRLRRFDAS